ncbi:hypothetical protein [Roseateles sp. MS654]|uniref:hypothetical protein n=1 Tax=Roseateles sp. MS654 TaxID=3412685 RepID=UPI003C30D7D0
MLSAESRRLWTWPIALGVLSTSGLLSALVSDEWGDVWSWVGLGVPVLVLAWYAWRPARAD